MENRVIEMLGGCGTGMTHLKKVPRPHPHPENYNHFKMPSTDLNLGTRLWRSFSSVCWLPIGGMTNPTFIITCLISFPHFLSERFNSHSDSVY